MAQRPNIICVIADDMGYGDFEVFNEGRSQTPSLNRLVDEGLCLTQHYTGSPICSPSRASFLTGRYPHRTGALETREYRGLDRIALRETTIADLFRRGGYATGLIGKWHNGECDPRFHPNARGFDEFVGFCGGWMYYYDWLLDYNGRYRKTDGRYLTDVFTDDAVDFVRRHRDEPFFLMLTYNAPHTPLEAPVEDVAPFRETGRFTDAVSIIYGMIRRMDHGLGRLLDELKTLGIEDNTLVAFTSDNGPQFGGKGDRSTRRFNCGFNGAKSFVYEGGIRVPMVLRWPGGGIGGGERCDAFAHFTDWLPTLLNAAGIDDRGDLPLDGCDIMPVLLGECDGKAPRRFWQWNRYSPVITSNAAMRDGDWKLVRPRIVETCWTSPEEQAMDLNLRHRPDFYSDRYREPEPERKIPPPGPPQLFNIAADPREQNDLARSDPGRVSRTLTELETWFESVEADRALIDD